MTSCRARRGQSAEADTYYRAATAQSDHDVAIGWVMLEAVGKLVGICVECSRHEVCTSMTIRRLCGCPRTRMLQGVQQTVVWCVARRYLAKTVICAAQERIAHTCSNTGWQRSKPASQPSDQCLNPQVATIVHVVQEGSLLCGICQVTSAMLLPTSAVLSRL